MKGPPLFFIALIIGLLVASGCISSPTSPVPAPATPVPQEGRPHYVIGVDGDYPPFTYRDSGGNFTGFDIEAARWIADREGFDVEFVAVPWGKILAALQEGTIDMIYSGIAITPERQKYANFTTSYLTVNASIAIRQGSTIIVQDLYAGRLRIGAQEKTTEADWVKENLVQSGKMPASNLVLYPDISQLTESLANGTIDASVIDAPVQERAVTGKSLTIIGEIPTMARYAVAIRKTDPQLLTIMDNGLRQLMNDQYWQQLEEKYGLVREPGSP